MRRILLMVGIFISYAQNTYGAMKVIEWCPDTDKQKMQSWYKANAEQINNTCCNPNKTHTSNYFVLYRASNTKQFATRITPDEVAILNLGSLIAVARNVFVKDLTPLITALSSSASSNMQHPLTFAIDVALSLNSNDEKKIQRKIALITATNESDKKTIKETLESFLNNYNTKKDFVSQQLDQLSIKSSQSSFPLIRYLMGSMLAGLVVALILIYKGKTKRYGLFN